MQNGSVQNMQDGLNLTHPTFTSPHLTSLFPSHSLSLSQESYSGMVTENIVMDTILTVIATDRDKAETPNAEITFSWCAEDPDNFVMRTIADNTIGIGNSVGLVSGSLTDTAPAVWRDLVDPTLHVKDNWNAVLHNVWVLPCTEIIYLN